jgi:LacI family transcriptional regulator
VKYINNIEEIAKASGVSRSTVSRVINNDENVKESTRQRVLEVIQRRNYQPNLVARRLASGRTRIIGLVIPATVSALFADPYFPVLIQGVTSACNAHEYAMMLWLAEPEHERRIINQIAHNGLLDGVIIASSVLDDPLHNLLLEDRFPFVMVGRHPSLPNLSYVDVDNWQGARDAVSYLIRLGRRRVATITGPHNMIAGLDRRDGYLAALRDRGLVAEPALMREGDFTEAGGYHQAQRLLPAHPDAIFAASDTMARGAMRALREAGVRVPEDVAVVGFDDLPFAAHTDPPLTTVRQPVLRTGQLAVEGLLEILKEPSPQPHRVVLPTELVIRASCGSGLTAARSVELPPKEVKPDGS